MKAKAGQPCIKNVGEKIIASPGFLVFEWRSHRDTTETQHPPPPPPPPHPIMNGACTCAPSFDISRDISQSHSF